MLSLSSTYKSARFIENTHGWNKFGQVTFCSALVSMKAFSNGSFKLWAIGMKFRPDAWNSLQVKNEKKCLKCDQAQKSSVDQHWPKPIPMHPPNLPSANPSPDKPASLYGWKWPHDVKKERWKSLYLIFFHFNNFKLVYPDICNNFS